ncbi:MAG TPA: hypothetical protein VH020_07025 [Stellaceae bacterium]|nr:hypothetical protein [Stellaceae bacterium]
MDTGYWIALYSPRDRHHARARELADQLSHLSIIFPWPILYETVNTRLARDRDSLFHFEKVVTLSSTVTLDDIPYRDAALSLCFASALHVRPRPISLVDCVIRLILDSTDVKIDGLLTFNSGDFFDICKKRRIELIS